MIRIRIYTLYVNMGTQRSQPGFHCMTRYSARVTRTVCEVLLLKNDKVIFVVKNISNCVISRLASGGFV